VPKPLRSICAYRGAPFHQHSGTAEAVPYDGSVKGRPRSSTPKRRRHGRSVLVGMLALTDLLTARTRILEAEQRRERVLGTRLRWPRRDCAA
jgi:hypothetical protein